MCIITVVSGINSSVITDSSPNVLCICQWFWCKSLAKTNWSIKWLILSHKVLNLVLFNFARNTFAIIFLFVHIKVKAFMIKIACKVVRINRIFLFTWPYQWLISKTIWKFEILNILLITLIQNCVLFLERGSLSDHSNSPLPGDWCCPDEEQQL